MANAGKAFLIIAVGLIVGLVCFSIAHKMTSGTIADMKAEEVADPDVDNGTNILVLENIDVFFLLGILAFAAALAYKTYDSN